MGFSFLLTVCDIAIVAQTELSPPSPPSFPLCASHRLVAPFRAGGGGVRDGAAILGGQVLQFQAHPGLHSTLLGAGEQNNQIINALVFHNIIFTKQKKWQFRK